MSFRPTKWAFTNLLNLSNRSNLEDYEDYSKDPAMALHDQSTLGTTGALLRIVARAINYLAITAGESYRLKGRKQ